MGNKKQVFVHSRPEVNKFNDDKVYFYVLSLLRWAQWAATNFNETKRIKELEDIIKRLSQCKKNKNFSNFKLQDFNKIQNIYKWAIDNHEHMPWAHFLKVAWQEIFPEIKGIQEHINNPNKGKA